MEVQSMIEKVAAGSQMYQAGRMAAKHARRKRLMKILLGLGALGTGAYLGYRHYAGRGGAVPAPTIPPFAPTPSPKGSKLRSAVAIPAGLGLTALGAIAARPALRKPLALFGKNVVKQARKHGVVSVYDTSSKKEFLSGFGNVVNNVRGVFGRKKLDPAAVEAYAKRIGRVFEGDPIGKDVVRSYDFSPMTRKATGTVVGATASARARKLWDNKEFQRQMLEAAGVKGLMPEALSAKDKSWLIRQLSSAAKAGKASEIDDKFINDLLKTRTGKDWFLKELSLTSSRDPSRPLFSKGFFENLREPSDFARQFKNVTINENRPSQEMSSFWQKFFKSKWYKKRIAKHLPEAGDFGYGGEVTPRREYRVHVANGKVVPFATSDRWDPLWTWSTFETPKKMRMEKKVQQALDKIIAYQETHPTRKGFKPGELDIRKQVFGLDVALDRKGNPVIYEFNPTMSMKEHAGSGHLLYPEHREVYEKAIKGLPSWTQVIQGAAGTGTALAGARMTANGIQGLREG